MGVGGSDSEVKDSFN